MSVSLYVFKIKVYPPERRMGGGADSDADDDVFGEKETAIDQLRRQVLLLPLKVLRLPSSDLNFTLKDIQGVLERYPKLENIIVEWGDDDEMTDRDALASLAAKCCPKLTKLGDEAYSQLSRAFSLVHETML
ncbi:hypothetical protein BG015_003587 [Linnemannia schmuckeri]|uniref:Uncharacterized protein n=1 Tax=Linnemannia schmuckeri TaxID=64567 RepID=A0A9P5S9J6_9FUNG|nr:hypothetical protein BG015_003587 [Linnemannia schmuckeri]